MPARIQAEVLQQLDAGITVGGVDRRCGTTTAPTPVVDKDLARRFALLQGLTRRDKETVARTIDALVAARGGGRAA